MGEFENQLWSDLLEAHGEQLATAQRPPRSRVRPAALAVGGIGMAGVALAVTLTVTTGPPAYAVTRNADGTVTVAIHDISGVTGANALLAELGVRAHAVTYDANCKEEPHPDPRHPEPYGWLIEQVPQASTPIDTVTIKPQAIPAGDTLVLATRVHPDGKVGVQLGVVRDPAPSCLGWQSGPDWVIESSLAPTPTR